MVYFINLYSEQEQPNSVKHITVICIVLLLVDCAIYYGVSSFFFPSSFFWHLLVLLPIYYQMWSLSSDLCM